MLKVTATSGFGAGSSEITDEFFSNVKGLWHMNGSDADTSGAGFADSSGNSHTLTAVANAQIDTAQYKFGGSSMLFDGTGDLVSAVDHADWDLLTNDFTLECWVRLASDVTGTFFGQWAGGAPRHYFIYNASVSKLEFSCRVVSDLRSTGTWTPSVDTWYHIAMTRDSANIRFFIDGTQLGSTDTSIGSTSIPAEAAAFTLGAYDVSAPTGSELNGWIDEARVTIGTARYTSNFTAPTEPFPDK